MLQQKTLFSLIITLFIASAACAGSYEHNSAEQKLYGTVEQIPQGGLGNWIIDGRSVLVNQRTKIENEYGQIAVGSYVEVEGASGKQGFQAYEIERKAKSDRKQNEYGKNYRHSSDDESREYGKGYAEKNEFYGVIEQIPSGELGTWRISGREVFVDRSTRIESEHGPLAVGAKVEVSGDVLAGKGVFYAREIETE